MILRHTFTPHNNIRLTHLCGPADSHLRTIEAALQVSIAHRHEQFKVDGPKAKATQAMELLQALYEMADAPISDDTLQLMLAGDAEMLEPDALEFAENLEAAGNRVVLHSYPWQIHAFTVMLRHREGAESVRLVVDFLNEAIREAHAGDSGDRPQSEAS